MPEFIAIQRKFVNAVLKIPTMYNNRGTRDRLLDGLPPAPINRSDDPRTDLQAIFAGLESLGRLKETGARPLIVVVDNALEYATGYGDVVTALNEVKLELKAFYTAKDGIDAQPTLSLPSSEELEAMLFEEQPDHRVGHRFIVGAQQTGRSVARLSIPRIFPNGPDGRAAKGTGWLIAPDLLITNYHVINARGPGEAPASPDIFRAQAKQIGAWFDYYLETGSHVNCVGGELVAAYQPLDYAIVRLSEAAKIDGRRPLRIVKEPPQLVRGNRLNIVQHSDGGPMQYAIRNNFFVLSGVAGDRIRYVTDTEQGASGSPVCSDDWEVVGLHHSSTSKITAGDGNNQAAVEGIVPPQEVIEGTPKKIKLLNEAIAIHSILDHLNQHPEYHALREEIDAVQAALQSSGDGSWK